MVGWPFRLGQRRVDPRRRNSKDGAKLLIPRSWRDARKSCVYEPLRDASLTINVRAEHATERNAGGGGSSPPPAERFVGRRP